MTAKKDEVISYASPHTIKKFELIEMYIKSWAQKLMLTPQCNGLIYIDCMCNSGLYHDRDGKLVYGSPVRVAKALQDVANTYRDKAVQIYFNDLSKPRIDTLRKLLPESGGNFTIVTTNEDAKELLKTIGPQLNGTGHMHYFLLYDPYDANIHWDVLLPFFRNWGEVMLNHAVLDSIRAVSSVKKQSTKEKYEQTYLEDFEDLAPYGSDKTAYEKRINEIIDQMRGNRRYYVASFPFYNSNNSLQYDLLHCTSNLAGFKLYKQCAWSVFGGKSSTKNVNTNYVQMELDFSNPGAGETIVPTDETCYTIRDIAKYLQNIFNGKQNVPLDELWKSLELHPVFPSEGFRNEITKELKRLYNDNVHFSQDPLTGQKFKSVSFSAQQG